MQGQTDIVGVGLCCCCRDVARVHRACPLNVYSLPSPSSSSPPPPHTVSVCLPGTRAQPRLRYPSLHRTNNYFRCLVFFVGVAFPCDTCACARTDVEGVALRGLLFPSLSLDPAPSLSRAPAHAHAHVYSINIYIYIYRCACVQQSHVRSGAHRYSAHIHVRETEREQESFAGPCRPSGTL